MAFYTRGYWNRWVVRCAAGEGRVVGLWGDVVSARPMTVEQVAQHWGCSDNHVRNLIHRGELKAFRLGRRMFRISPDAIGEYEKCQLQTTTGLDASTADSVSPGGRMESGDVIVLTHS